MPPLKTTSIPSIKLFSGALKAFVDEGSGRKRISCVASSTVEDLHGDEIDAKAIESMARQAVAKGMTIFLNHKYDIPEDIFGSTVTASASQIGLDPKSGKPLWELNLTTDLNEANPRAVETFSAIHDNGINVGVSIGALIRDWEFRDAKKQWDGGLLIKDLELLEASMVGIPANPRSWVKQARRAITRSYKTDDDGVLLTLNGSATSEAIDANAEDDDDELVEVTSAAPALPTPKNVTPDESDEDDEDQETPETVTASATPETPPAEADEAATSVADEETTSTVDLEAAKTIAKNLTVDATDAPLQELLLGLLETAGETIKGLRDENQELLEKAAKLESTTRERDQFKADLDEAMQVLQLMSRVPLARKTSLRRVVNKTASLQERFGHVYDEPFLRLLDETTDER